MACSGRVVLVERSVYGVMSYSRQTWPASLGSVPVPAVTFAMELRGEPAIGCRLLGARLLTVGAPPGARQALPESSEAVGACANTSPTALIIASAASNIITCRLISPASLPKR